MFLQYLHPKENLVVDHIHLQVLNGVELVEVDLM